MAEKVQNPGSLPEEQPTGGGPCCGRSGNPDRVPGERARGKSWKDGLNQVKCPWCGAVFWTNQETIRCRDCRKSI